MVFVTLGMMQSGLIREKGESQVQRENRARWTSPHLTLPLFRYPDLWQDLSPRGTMISFVSNQNISLLLGWDNGTCRMSRNVMLNDQRSGQETKRTSSVSRWDLHLCKLSAPMSCSRHQGTPEQSVQGISPSKTHPRRLIMDMA